LHVWLVLASRAVKERKTASETRSLPNCPAPAASIASPIAPWPKSESFGNMPTRMSFLRTLSPAQVEAFRILRCRSALWLSSLCASSSPLVTNLMPKRRRPLWWPRSHLVGLLSHADGSGLLPEALPKAHRPFLARDPPRLDAGHRLQFRQHLTKSDGKTNPLTNHTDHPGPPPRSSKSTSLPSTLPMIWRRAAAALERA
jgi:hypothetical protein